MICACREEEEEIQPMKGALPSNISATVWGRR